MIWKTHYLSPDPSFWQGRSDIPPNSCLHQQIKLVDLLQQPLKPCSQLAFAFIGFRCDEGVQRDCGRIGAYEGPTSIRLRLSKLPIHRTNTAFYDVGDVSCTSHDLEASQHALGEIITLLLKNNRVPIVLGGGHEVSLASYYGIRGTNLMQRQLGIINFDSHFDMQPIAPNHGGSATTTFYQVAIDHLVKERRFDYNCIGIQPADNIHQSFEFAKSQNTRFISAEDLQSSSPEKHLNFINRVADENEIMQVSLSMDVFSPAYAPGVSSIQPLGLSPWQVIPLLRQSASSGKVICYDIAEHAPRYDVDYRTSKLAASLIYEIIHHHHEPIRQATSQLV